MNRFNVENFKLQYASGHNHPILVEQLEGVGRLAYFFLRENRPDESGDRNLIYRCALEEDSIW